MLIKKNLESDSAKIDRRENNENRSCLYKFMYPCNTMVKLCFCNIESGASLLRSFCLTMNEDQRSLLLSSSSRFPPPQGPHSHIFISCQQNDVSG